MAPLIPPILLLFDTTAILATKTRDWSEFSRLGECYAPDAVLEQLEYMNDHASEPEVEAIAREFTRFYSNNDWKKTNSLADHPLLKPAAGHTLSKRARLSLDVLRCAYGMALRYPDSLIVLVANDQAMLQQVLNLQVKNLCGIPLTALVQWNRTQRRPQTVSQHLLSLRTTSNVVGDPKAVTPRKSATTARSSTSPTTIPAPKVVSAQANRQRRMARSLKVSSLIANLVSVIVLMVAVAAIWRVVHPVSFNQLWRQLPIIQRQR